MVILCGTHPDAITAIHFAQLVEKCRAIKTPSVTETANAIELCSLCHRVMNVDQWGYEKY